MRQTILDNDGYVVGSFDLSQGWVDFAFLGDKAVTRLTPDNLVTYLLYQDILQARLKGIDTKELVGKLLARLSGKFSQSETSKTWIEKRTVRNKSYQVLRWRDSVTGKKMSKYLRKLS